MAKATYIKIQGVCAWARVQPDNFDDYRGEKNWKICLFPDKESVVKLKEAGSQVRVKYDDGEKSGVEGKFYQFKRQVERDWGKGEGVQPLTPVQVTLNGEEYDGLIGNGSKVEVTLEIYPTRNFGNGTRLVAVDILDLIVYNKEEDEGTEDDEAPFDVEEKSVEDIVISEEPKKVVVKPTKKVAKVEW